ncbi:hypothetical protein [Methylobacterium marchantiae]|uniref:Uncharacterized protein n=1 Tax=Methylobacterium marchantiae TaxID=600331 RepID=A0ABW3WZY5_9HYPH
MRLKEFEDWIGKVGKVSPDLTKQVDGAKSNFEPIVHELAGGTIEEFRDVSATRKFRLRGGRARLSPLRRQFPPGKQQTAESRERQTQIPHDLRNEDPGLHLG